MTSTLNTTSSSRFTYIIEFHHQSQDINFATWVSLFTLCLAPLIAHLIAGTPTVVYLHDSRPRWHETIVHYNPTAIIWRYFAITDRRIRSRNWNPLDMAAGNALFWTSHGWDGSPEIMVKSRELCIQTPSSTWSRLFSIDTLKTLVVALQGAQAFYLLAVSIWENVSRSGGSAALDTIFMPLAMLGLLRLLAALWLTDEPLFISNGGHEKVRYPESATKRVGSDDSAFALLSMNPEPYDSGITLHKSRPPVYNWETHFHRGGSARGIAVRVVFIVFLLAILTICFMQMFSGGGGIYSVTTFLLGYFYAIFIIATTGICLAYFVIGRSSPLPATILPCITTLWFKLYTATLIVMMLILIIFAALETRQTPCGVFTTFDPSRDPVICAAPSNNTNY